MTNPVLSVRGSRRSNPALPKGTVLDTDNDDHWVSDGRAALVWCPGCDGLHRLQIVGEDGVKPDVCWEWDGDLESPTFSPSLLCDAAGTQPRCHSFIRAGRWEFLSDCDHGLAGQTVDMVPLPDWIVN